VKPVRHASVDVQRTIAIALMVLVHFVENLSGQGKFAWLPAGLSAPSFLLLLGVSQQLSVAAQQRRQVPEELITKRSVRRGLCLIALGFAFNLLVWLPDDIFNWDVLTLAGLAILALAAVRRWPEPVVWVVCGLLFAGGPVLRHLVGYDQYWTLGYFDPDATLTDVLGGALVTGYFPVFPWLLIPLVGSLVARRLFPEVDARGAHPAGSGGAGAVTSAVAVGGAGGGKPGRVAAVWWGGIGAVATAGLLLATRSWMPAKVQTRLVTGWTMFPPSVVYVLGMVGASVLVLAGLVWWLESRGRGREPGRFVEVCGSLSRHSLSIYWLHHLVHVWPLWIGASWRGEEATAYWQQALPMPWAVTAAIAFLILCVWLFPRLERAGLPTLETALRWLCD